jgi:hypothetical protein
LEKVFFPKFAAEGNEGSKYFYIEAMVTTCFKEDVVGISNEELAFSRFLSLVYYQHSFFQTLN